MEILQAIMQGGTNFVWERMRFSFVGVLLFLLLIRCGPQERSIEEVSQVQEGELFQYYYNGTPFSGLVIDQTKPTVKIIYTVKEGVFNGATKHFNQVNQLLLHQNYISGKLNGLVTSFFDDGTKHYAYQYLDGKKSGSQKLYYPSGKIKSALFYQEGSLTGDNYLYYMDGKLQHHFHFNSVGQRDGVWEKYHSNGQLKEVITYEQGELVSPAQRYDVNGNLIANPRSN